MLRWQVKHGLCLNFYPRSRNLCTPRRARSPPNIISFCSSELKLTGPCRVRRCSRLDHQYKVGQPQGFHTLWRAELGVDMLCTACTSPVATVSHPLTPTLEQNRCCAGVELATYMLRLTQDTLQTVSDHGAGQHTAELRPRQS